MKQSKFDQTRDQIIADRPDYQRGYTPEQMCSAHGCPNRWTVDRGARLCSSHDREHPERWPGITERQQWDETERARVRGMGEPR